MLGVRGRRSGEVRTTPVNPLRHDGARYLVAARGETQWVRNLRVAGEAELTVGRRTERVAATELTEPAAVVPVLREYLRRWAWEVGAFFDGVDASSSDAELAAVAHRHPDLRPGRMILLRGAGSAPSVAVGSGRRDHRSDGRRGR